MEYIESLLQYFSQKVPLEIYSLFGGFLEEVISPIPSPLIMTTAGSIAQYRGFGFTYLLWLSLLASVGKTVGCLLFYVIADKLGDVFVTKYGKYFGLEQKTLTALGAYFNNTWKDDFILIILRAIPIFPALPISVICGLIKLNMNTYIRSTFIGDFIRSLFFAVIGFYGFEGYQELLSKLNSYEDIVYILLAILGIGFIGLLYKAKNETDFFSKFEKYLKKNN